jgi:hypothetical protein
VSPGAGRGHRQRHDHRLRRRCRSRVGRGHRHPLLDWHGASGHHRGRNGHAVVDRRRVGCCERHGVIVITGTGSAGAPSSPASGTGSITITGTASAGAAVTGSGVIVLGGVATVRVSASGTGLLTLSALANAQAGGVAPSHVYGYATVQPQQYGTATLEAVF